MGNINIDLDTNISTINKSNVLSIIDIYHSEISENLHFYTSVNKINADFIRILYDTLIMGKIYTDVNVTHELDYAQFTKLTGIDLSLSSLSYAQRKIGKAKHSSNTNSSVFYLT